MKDKNSDSLPGISLFLSTMRSQAQRFDTKIINRIVRSIAPLLCMLGVCMLAPCPNLRGQSFGIPAMSQSADKAWIESLIDNRAAALAKEVCQFSLDRSVPDSNANAQWKMLLLQASTAQQLETIDWNSPIASLESALEQIGKIAKTPPPGDSGPRGPWVQWKELWCRRLIQQHTLAAYLAVPGRKALKEWLLQSIRIGLDELEGLEQVVLKLQPDKPIVTRPQRELKDKTLPNEITAGEILDLRGEIELLRADLLYQRSECYLESRDETIAAATQMLSSIERASAQLPASWSHRPLLVLARAQAELQLERYAAVEKSMNELWDSLGRDSNPEAKSWRIAAASLAIRSARFTDQWSTADAWFSRVGGWKNSPELALEHIAIMVKRELDRSMTPESILAIRKEISDRFGVYWQQRVDAMLVSNPTMKGSQLLESSASMANSNQSMASLELFRIQARQAIAANDIDTAIEKLQQAELAASKQSALQEAFGFAMQIAALLERTGQQTAAADEFYRAAISYPDSPKAASASMMSAWLIRGDAPKLDDEAKRLRSTTYLQRLKETATLWPKSPSANQAIDLLEDNWLSNGKYVACLDFWKEYLTKETGAENRALRRWLLVALLTQEDWLESPVEDGAALSRASDELGNALMQIAKSRANKSSDEGLAPEKVSAWMQSVGSDRRWPPTVRIELPPTDANDLIGQLADSWDRCEEEWQLGRLSSQSVEKLKQLSDVCQERIGSPVLLASGRLGRFLELVQTEMNSKNSQELKSELETRIAREPKSLWWVYRVARTMQRTGGMDQSSLGWYRQMASGVKPGSQPWLEARARTIELLQSSGETLKATQLRDLVLASYPDLPSHWRWRLSLK